MKAAAGGGATPQQEKSSSQGEGAAENQAQQASAAPKFGGGFGKKAATAGAGEGSQASSASSKPSFGSSFGKKAASAGATSGNAEEAKSADGSASESSTSSGLSKFGAKGASSGDGAKKEEQQQSQGGEGSEKKKDATPLLAVDASEAASKIVGDKTVRDLLRQFSTAFEEQEKNFNKVAQDVRRWDAKLVAITCEVEKMGRRVHDIGKTQADLAATVENIEENQLDLEAQLDSLNREADELLAKEPFSSADEEREKMYSMATGINRQLDSMTSTLQDVVKRLSEPQKRFERTQDPMWEIMEKLNVHLQTLSWVDQKSELLASKIKKVEKAMADR